MWASRENDDHVMPAGFYFEIEDTLWALGNLARSSIARFSLSSGISTIVDKRGAGPGEFTYADEVQLHPAGDTLLVFHGKRLSYFTVQLTEARSVQTMVGSPAGMLVLPNQQVIFVEPRIRQLARASGYVLHMFAQEGQYIKSFRPVDQVASGDDWPIATGYEPNTLWLVEPGPNGFTLEQWDAASTNRIHRFQVEPAWWQSETRSPADYEKKASQKAVMTRLPTGPQAVADAGHVLLVALRQFDVQHDKANFSHFEPHRWFDGVLLALDRKSGGILAAHVFDEFIFGFTNRGRLILYDADATGGPRIKLVEVTFQNAG
ncbi:MAG: hypothetical protein ACRENP_23300 [Longimicrobiales bacterium]